MVVPASTLANWEDELERFCPSLNVYTYHGSQKERSSMRSELRSGINEVDVLLTTYTIFERESGADDRKFLQNQSFDYLVLDEAHSIKNSASSRFIQLNRMRTRHRLLISGTPVQNDLQELLSLLSFLMPKVFRSSDCEILLEAFGNNNSNKSDKFGSSASSTLSLGKMKSVLAPFVLRRLKKDVLSQLVEKQVVDVKLAMTPFQRTVYAGIITSYACRKEKQKLDFESKEADFEGVNLHNIVATDRSSAAQKKEVINLLSPSTSSSSSIDGGLTAPIEADQFLKRDLSQSEANHLFTALRKAANHPLLLRVHFSDPEVMSRIAQIAFQSEHYGSQCTLKMVREELESLSDFDLNQICIEHKHYLGTASMERSFSSLTICILCR